MTLKYFGIGTAAAVFGLWLTASPAAATNTVYPGGSLSDDVIEGTIQNIDPAHRTFEVARNGKLENLWASYGSLVVRDGFNVSFEALRVGDRVAVRYPPNAPAQAARIQATSSERSSATPTGGVRL